MIRNQPVMGYGLVLLLFLLACPACSFGPPVGEIPAGATLLRGAGASFPNPLYQKWAHDFGTKHADVVVEYESVGSGRGIELFLEESVDFGASDRGMSDEQIAQAPRGALLVPMTAGMVVLPYNAEGLPKNLRLARDVYVDIFLGKITKWNDPRICATQPDFEFPDKKITVVARQDKSGTTFAFTNHLSAISQEWKNGPGAGQSVQWTCAPLRAPGNEGVVAMIERTPYAIGYAEFGQAKRLGLRMAQLENHDHQYVSADGGAGLEALLKTEMPENFRVFLPDPAGPASYPIITYTWILAHSKYENSAKGTALRVFLEWCLTEGQNECEALGFVRLPATVAQRATEAVRTIQ